MSPVCAPTSNVIPERRAVDSSGWGQRADQLAALAKTI
jgi:hypothetical protein